MGELKEKERKTEAGVAGQCKCGLEGEGTVRRADADTGCVEATREKHRPTQKSENMRWKMMLINTQCLE